MSDGIFMHKGRAVVPSSNKDLVKNICEIFHCELDHVHPGQLETIHIIKKVFWWVGMKDDIIAFVKSCDACQRSKYSNKTLGKIITMGVPNGKWNVVSMDFTDMPLCEGFNSLLVVVDKFSKMVKLIPMLEKVTKTGDVIRLLNKEVFGLFGVPEVVVSDRDVRFTNKE